jgi:hypothetical protein
VTSFQCETRSFYTRTCILNNLLLTCKSITILLHSPSNRSFFFKKKKLKIYQSYAPSLGSLVGYVGLLASCTFALTLGTHFCLCHESLLLTLETLVHARTLHFCPYFRDPLYVPAPLHHVTHHHLSFDTTC